MFYFVFLLVFSFFNFSTALRAHSSEHDVFDRHGAESVVYAYPVLRTIEIDANVLADCFTAHTVHTLNTYNLPSDHGFFSPDQMNFLFTENDFLDYLPAYSSRKYDYATGHEDELKNWILGQPENSIDPMKIYDRALYLNRHHKGAIVWNAVLTIHQLLRQNARWWDRRHYHYQSSYREQTAFFNKFIDLRGDLRERGIDEFSRENFTGDHAGTWYRIWGIMLYRFMLAQQGRFWRSLLLGPIGSVLIGSEYQNAKALAVSSFAEWVKFAGDEFEDDFRKAEINRKGAMIADAMLLNFENRKNKKIRLDFFNSCLESQFYLKKLYY